MNPTQKIAVVRGSELNRFEMQPYEALVRAGLDVVAVGSRRGNHDLSGLELPLRRVRTCASIDRLPSRLRTVLERRGFDSGRLLGLDRVTGDRSILHAAETFIGFSDQCASLASSTNKQLVLTCWENIPFRHDEVPHLAARKRRVIAAADAFVAVTQEAQDALLLEGACPLKISVVPAAVDLDRFSPGPRTTEVCERWRVPADAPVLLFVGRLIPEKGWEDLLLAFHQLRQSKQHADVHLVFVGTGPCARAIAAMASRLGIGRQVRVEPFMAYDELPSAYRAASAVVVPSRPTPYWAEQFGMVLVEAMASGRPVVTTRGGSIPGVVGDAAVMVEPYRPGQLMEALRGVLQSPALASDLARRGRARAETCFDAQIVARQLASIYESLP
jgi:glycosyltransferase involved in cell wall biosynthesis